MQVRILLSSQCNNAEIKNKKNERFNGYDDRRILIGADREVFRGIGGDSYTLDQIRECAMKSISKMTADLGEKEDQS